MNEPTYAIQVTFDDDDVRYICGLTEKQVKTERRLKNEIHDVPYEPIPREPELFDGVDAEGCKNK